MSEWQLLKCQEITDGGKTGENIKSYFVVLWYKKRWLRNKQGDPSLQEKSLAGGINKYIFRLFYQ
mgnify:CR=1 FL=1